MGRTAVIGGGAAGLAAAWTLSGQRREDGPNVVLFESSEVCGGVLCSDVLDGANIDSGVQLLGSNYSELFRIAREAGAGDLLVRSPGRDALWRDGRIHGITYGSVPSMVISGALPTTLKLKLATKYVPFLTREGARLNVNDLPGAGGLAQDGESIAAWGMRELGRDFVEYLVYPLLAAYYGNVPESTTAGLYHALARVGMDVSVYAVRGGMSQLPSRVVQRLRERGIEVRTESRVDAVEPSGKGYAITVGGERHDFDEVILAVPPAVAGQLVPDDSVRKWLEGVRTIPATTVALLTTKPVKTDYFGLSIPRDNGVVSDVVAFCNESHKVPGLVPPGMGLVVVLPAPSIADEVAQLAPNAVVDRIMPALKEAMPSVPPMIRHARVFRHDRGYVQFYPGYVRHLAGYSKLRLPDGLRLAGDYLQAPTVEGAVRSGIRAINGP